MFGPVECNTAIPIPGSNISIRNVYTYIKFALKEQEIEKKYL